MKRCLQTLCLSSVFSRITLDLIYLITNHLGMQLPNKKTAFGEAIILIWGIPPIISLIQFGQDTFSIITEFNPYNLHASVH